jgi:homoserine kinase type II
MAVYTHVPAEDLAVFLQRYDVGVLKSAKGIAEGVENSNYLVETSQARFILTLYEKRVNRAELPFFLGLMSHLAAAGLPCPEPIRDRSGQALQELHGRAACLIEFVPGLSLAEPTAPHCFAVGQALAKLHLAAKSYTGRRTNDLSLAGWQQLAARCGAAADTVQAGLSQRIAAELTKLTAAWPTGFDQCVIHADLFPDNVLFDGETVAGLIDFYFAAYDLRLYDLAVTHSAWCFNATGEVFHVGRSHALIDGYATIFPIQRDERDALPVLCRGAALRFLLTRLYDWQNRAPGALVTPKDPLAFDRRLAFYQQPGLAL